MKVVCLDENFLVQCGVSVLIKKLGAVDAKRFLSLAVNRCDDSVKRHRRTVWMKRFFTTMSLLGNSRRCFRNSFAYAIIPIK